MAVSLAPSTPEALTALATTLERSKQLCLQMYEKELFTETSYKQMALQTQFKPDQLAVFAGKTLNPAAETLNSTPDRLAVFAGKP